MPLLSMLETELILQILLILEENSPSSLREISYVCKRLYILAQTLKFSTLPLTFSKSSVKSTERIMTHVSQDTRASGSVRKILILFYPADLPHIEDAARRSFTLLIELLPRLRGLKHVSYKVDNSFAMKGLNFRESDFDHDFGMLPTVLNALHKHHPRCRLGVSLPARMDPVSPLSPVANSPCLYSLTIAIQDKQYLACGELIRIATTCTNLKVLKILSFNVTMPYRCLYLASPGDGDAVMSLDSLDLDGPIFYPGEHEYVRAKQETSPFDFVDLPSLRRLSLTHFEHMLTMPSTSINLRYLSFNPAKNWGSDLSDKIKALLPTIFADQRLEELYLTGCTDVLSIVSMKPLKDSLKRLKIHENEDESAIYIRRVFSAVEIQTLGETLTNLEYLSLDVNYNGEWPYETLSTISRSFPSLIHQELSLEISISNRSQPLHPAATLTSTLDIWAHIWKETAATRLALPHLINQPRLRALDINAGSFRPKSSGFPPGPDEWKQYEQREQQTFRVRRHEHEDKAKDDIATVTSAQVEQMERKLGIGRVRMSVQLRMLEDARERARNGVMGVWDRMLDRNGPAIRDVIDNDYVLLLMMDSVMA